MYWIRIILLLSVPSVGLAQTTIVDFDNPSPPGSQGSFLQGEFDGVNWGSNRWRWTGSYARNNTNHVYFGSGSGNSRDITLSAAPRVFGGVDVYTLSPGTLTINDDQGQFLEQFITTGPIQSVTTGWTLASTVVTISFTGGWDLGVDNFIFSDGAPPPTPAYPVTVTPAGAGSGVITSEPAGIDCGASCAADFDENTVVTLTAVPAAGSTFDAWSGNADCADGQLVVTEAVNCSATFSLLPPPPIQYDLSVSLLGNGAGTVSSAPSGIDCGLDCQETFDENTLVVLTPQPGLDSQFDAWGGAADCADGVVEMTANLSCSATFSLLPPPPPEYSLTVSLSGTGNGTVTSSPGGIDCGSDCQEIYTQGTQVMLTAMPDIDSEFAGWGGDAACSDAVLQMTSDITCIAIFTEIPPPIQYSLTVSLLGTGSGTVTSSPGNLNCLPDCTESFLENTDVVLTAMPTGFSNFVGWSGDADCADGVVAMSQDISCAAEFELPGGGAGSALQFTGLGSAAADRDRIKFMIDDVSTDMDPAFPLDVGAGDFTIEFWMRADSADNQAGFVNCGAGSDWISGNVIVDRDRFNRPLSFGLSVGGGQLAFGVTGPNSVALTICGNSFVLDNNWHHIAIQRRSMDGQLWIYVDGSLDAFGQGAAGDISYPDDALPGRFCGTGGNQRCVDSDPYLVIGAEKHDVGPEFPAFAGVLDELRISDVLRYSGGFTRPTAPFIRDANTLGLYHFDEGAGEVVRDDIAVSDGGRDGVVRFGGDGSTYGPIWVESDAPLGN